MADIVLSDVFGGGCKWPTTCSAKLNNAWSCTFTSLYIWIVCSFVGGQLYSAFVLPNIKRSLCILTDCVSPSHSSAMKSYHLLRYWDLVPLKYSVCVYSLIVLYHWTAQAAVGLPCICIIRCWKPGPETGWPVIFRGFPQLLETHFKSSHTFTPTLFPFVIYWSFYHSILYNFFAADSIVK
jgi:hypothetical protein